MISYIPQQSQTKYILYFSINITTQNFVNHIKWHYCHFHLKFSERLLVDFRVFKVEGEGGVTRYKY